jgi:glycosyltransferase involved in cell wall biosynthesis
MRFAASRANSKTDVRVGIDAQLANGTATGIGEYVRGLTPALREAGVDVVELDYAALDPWRFDRRALWDQALLPIAAARARVDVVHCAAGTMPLAASAPIVVTVHDVAWLRVQAHARPYARAYFGPYMLSRYARARGIIVDSTFSRDELLAVAPELDPTRIAVVFPGVARDMMEVVRARDDAAPFVLAVGTVERRKNLEVLIGALATLPTLRLVSVGPPTPYRERCLAIARAAGVADRVEFRGYVSRVELLGLYARARVAAVPSHYEGFGYGAAQALCAGVPLLVSEAASLPEVAGRDVPWLPPDDTAVWSQALAAIAAAPDEAERRAASRRDAARDRFAWSTAARATNEAYARAVLRADG